MKINRQKTVSLLNRVATIIVLISMALLIIEALYALIMAVQDGNRRLTNAEYSVAIVIFGISGISLALIAITSYLEQKK